MTPDLKQQILSRVAPDLTEIECALKENLDAHLDLVAEVAGHILFAGGKRLRPLLMVLCARLCGYAEQRAPFFATIFEYLHAATLLHDDLVDDAAVRRGRTVAHKVYGNPVAVLTGDFLLARSLTVAAETGSPEVIRVIAGITENMSQGEIHQLTQKENTALSEAEYLEIIRRKTAVLIEGACRVGALVAGAPAADTDALTRYGYHLGIAFQMADDLLDYTADTATLGKAVGADLREGKLTLPVIRALEQAPAEERGRMTRIIRNPDFSEAEFSELIALMTTYDGIDYTRREARRHVGAARQELERFAPSETRELLGFIADYALLRKQ